MTKRKIKKAIKIFEGITGIAVIDTYFSKGSKHEPSKLEPDMQGVYVFYDNKNCFKVGRAGPKSQARWNSHHYNLDKTTKSSFSKSLYNDKENFRSYFSYLKKEEIKKIDKLNKSTIGQWIKDNTSRVELLIPDDKNNRHSLNLLEALIQHSLKPIYEGKINKR